MAGVWKQDLIGRKLHCSLYSYTRVTVAQWPSDAPDHRDNVGMSALARTLHIRSSTNNFRKAATATPKQQ